MRALVMPHDSVSASRRAISLALGRGQRRPTARRGCALSTWQGTSRDYKPQHQTDRNGKHRGNDKLDGDFFSGHRTNSLRSTSMEQYHLRVSRTIEGELLRLGAVDVVDNVRQDQRNVPRHKSCL